VVVIPRVGERLFSGSSWIVLVFQGHVAGVIGVIGAGGNRGRVCLQPVAYPRGGFIDCSTALSGAGWDNRFGAARAFWLVAERKTWVMECGGAWALEGKNEGNWLAPKGAWDLTPGGICGATYSGLRARNVSPPGLAPFGLDRGDPRPYMKLAVGGFTQAYPIYPVVLGPPPTSFGKKWVSTVSPLSSPPNQVAAPARPVLGWDRAGPGLAGLADNMGGRPPFVHGSCIRGLGLFSGVHRVLIPGDDLFI